MPPLVHLLGRNQLIFNLLRIKKQNQNIPKFELNQNSFKKVKDETKRYDEDNQTMCV
jgi:hypothetical protein